MCRPYVTDTSLPSEPCTKPNEEKQFFFEPVSVYPEYLTDVNILGCPSDRDGVIDIDAGRFHFGRDPENDINPCRIDWASYMYFGWLANNDTILLPGVDPNVGNPDLGTHFKLEVLTKINELFDASSTVRAQVGKFDAEVEIGGDVIYRLREGLERFLITDINNPAAGAVAQSELAVMFDQSTTEVRDFNHIPGGGNILYMDGHVEFTRYPGDFPFTTTFAFMSGELSIY
jgi:prepilin-type processing-associated H-X9-DG protein